MPATKSNHRLAAFEKLESRWLLAANNACEAVDVSAEANIEVVAELLDPVDIEAEVECEERADEPQPEESDSVTPDEAGDRTAETSDGQDESESNEEVSEEDVIRAFDEQGIGQGIGGEGESGGEGEASSRSVQVAALLGQMLEFVSDSGVANSVDPVATDRRADVDDVGILPPDFQRVHSRSDLQMTDLTRESRTEVNLLDNEPPQPVARLANESTREPPDVPAAVYTTATVDAVSETSELQSPASMVSAEASGTLDTSNETGANQQQQQVDAEIPALATNLDLSWVSDDFATEKERDSEVEALDRDDALMAYLRSIQWPLVPLVAGLSYAVTRSIDQQRETPEPQAMPLGRRRRRRLAYTK